GGGGAGQARRGGPERRPAADGAGQRPADGTARPAARHRRELPAAQVQRKLPRLAGPAGRDGEPYRGRPAGLQRGREPLQRLHPALPASADGEGPWEGATAVLRVGDAGRGAGAEGGFLQIECCGDATRAAKTVAAVSIPGFRETAQYVQRAAFTPSTLARRLPVLPSAVARVLALIRAVGRQHA